MLRGKREGGSVDGVRDSLEGLRGTGLEDERGRERETHGFLVDSHDEVLAVLDRDGRELGERVALPIDLDLDAVEQVCEGSKLASAPSRPFQRMLSHSPGETRPTLPTTVLSPTRRRSTASSIVFSNALRSNDTPSATSSSSTNFPLPFLTPLPLGRTTSSSS